MNGWFWTTIAFSSAVFLGSMVFIATVPAGTKGEIRLCDKVVSALLNSTDPVEIQRARIIVHDLRCGIGFRLDDAGAFKPRAGQ